MRPVRPYSRFYLIEARFLLYSLCWSVMLARLCSPMIFVSIWCGNTARSWSALSGISVAWAICCRGSGRLVLQGLVSASELSVEGEGACWTELSCVVPEINRQGQRSVSNGACRLGPGIISRGQESALDGTGCVGPGIICRGRRGVSDGTGCAGPGIIRRGKERVGRDWLRRPWNYPSGDRAGCVCGGWRIRRLWIRSLKVTLRRPRN